MKTSTLLISIGILAVTVVLGYFFSTRQKQERKVNKFVADSSIVRDVKGIQINDMVFTLKEDKEIKKWEYNKDGKIFPINKERVDELLKSTSKLGQGRKIVTNPTDLTSYGLSKEDNKDTRIALVLKNNNKDIFSLVLGKESIPTQFFAQFNDDKAVYSINWPYKLSTSDDYWLDKALFVNTLDGSAITSIVIYSKKLDKKIELNKQDDEWKLVSSKEKTTNTDAITQYISFASKLKANNFADIEVTDELLYGTINLVGADKTENNREIKVYYFADAYYAKASGERNEYTFFIEKYIIDTLFPAKSHFIEEEQEEPKETKK